MSIRLMSLLLLLDPDFLRENIESDNGRDYSTYICAHTGEHTHGHTCHACKLMIAPSACMGTHAMHGN